MASNYERLAATAAVKILKASEGRTVTFLAEGTTLVDATRPWLGSTEGITDATAVIVATGPAIFIDPVEMREWGFALDHLDNEQTERVRQVAICAAAGLTYSSGFDADDVERAKAIRDRGRFYLVKRTQVLRPGVTPILIATQVHE